MMESLEQLRAAPGRATTEPWPSLSRSKAVLLLLVVLQSMAADQAIQWWPKANGPSGPWRTHREGCGGCQGSLSVVVV